MSSSGIFFTCLQMQEKKIPGSLCGYLVFSSAVYWHSKLLFPSSSSLQKNYRAHYPYELALHLRLLLIDAREEDTKEFIGIPCLLSSCKFALNSSFFLSLLHQAFRRTTVHLILMSLLCTFVSCLLMQEKKIQKSLWGYLVFSPAVNLH